MARNKWTLLIRLAATDLPGTILHAVELGGTVAMVEDRNGVRWYHAREFTGKGRNREEAGGYSTKEKHWYMGERYRNRALWGDYFSEVFWVEGESVRTVET
jgi:hypothetical protein